MNDGFFQEQREQSRIKARIVSKYFSAWANVILATQKIYPHYAQKMAYVDLFAGPGRYDDQSKSTPLLVLETIVANPDLANRMVALFNDKDTANIESLKAAIGQIDGINRLKYAPRFTTKRWAMRLPRCLVAQTWYLHSFLLIRGDIKTFLLTLSHQ